MAKDAFINHHTFKYNSLRTQIMTAIKFDEDDRAENLINFNYGFIVMMLERILQHTTHKDQNNHAKGS